MTSAKLSDSVGGGSGPASTGVSLSALRAAPRGGGALCEYASRNPSPASPPGVRSKSALDDSETSSSPLEEASSSSPCGVTRPDGGLQTNCELADSMSDDVPSADGGVPVDRDGDVHDDAPLNDGEEGADTAVDAIDGDRDDGAAARGDAGGVGSGDGSRGGSRGLAACVARGDSTTTRRGSRE